MSLDALIAVGLVAPVAAFFAWVFWMARIPGDPVHARSPRASAAIMAGIVAGVLLGPMVLGRIAPDFQGAAFIGTVDQLRAFERVQSEQRAERAALRETGVSEIALDELRAEQQRETDAQREAIHEVANAHRRSLLLGGLLPLVIVVGLGLGFGRGYGGGFGRGLGVRRGVWGAGRAAPDHLKTEATTTVFTGAMRQVLAIVAVFVLVLLIARLFVDRWWPAAAFAAGMMALGIPTPLRRDNTGWPPTIVANAMTVASVGGAMILPTALAWLGGRLIARCSPCRIARSMRRAGTGVAYAIALAGCIALALATIDPSDLLADRSFGWLALLAFLIGADFRWAAIGLSAPRSIGVQRRLYWREAALQIDHGTGVLQAIAGASIVLLGPLVHLPLAESIGAALFIGALTIELGKPIRHMMAHSLDAKNGVPG